MFGVDDAIGGAVGGIAQGVGQIFAANTAAKTAKNALNYQKQIRTDVMPYINAGSGAIGELNDPNQLLKNFQTSPNYNWTMAQGLNAVGTDKAVNGLLKSGGAVKGLATYATGLAGNQFNNYVAQRQNVAQMGLQGAGVASGAAGKSSDISMQAGANQGNLALTGGNTLAQMLGGLFNKYGAGGSSSYQSGPGAPMDF